MLWKYQAQKGAWYFLTIEKELAQRIKKANIHKSKGWGSIRVRATIGNTSWPTSIFPTKKGTFDLPVKAAVRKKEGLEEGNMVSLVFEPVFAPGMNR